MNPEDIAAASVNFTGMSPEQLRAATVYLLEQIRIGGGMGPGPYVEIAGDTMTGALSFSGTTNSGLRLNNLTTAQRNALAGPAAGMLVWDTTQTRLSVYDGSGWTDGFVRLAGDTMTGDLSVPDVTITANGALSDPSLSVTGTPITGGDATTTKPLVLIETTGATSTAWSTSGTMLGVNAPSGFAGRIADFQLDGISHFSVSSSGNITLKSTGALSWTADTFLVRDGAANTLAQRNSTTAQAFRVYGTYTDASNYRRFESAVTTAGVATLSSAGAGTGVASNQLILSVNGTTQAGLNGTVIAIGPSVAFSTAFPALKRSSAILQTRLADDSDYAAFEADTIRTAKARTVAQLPAAGSAGRRAYVTDANATTFMSVVAGGGANVVPVFDDGTNWVIA